MKRKCELLFRRKVLSLFARVRFLGLKPYVIDTSVYWTLISYRSLFFRFLLKGRILLQISDIVEWGWIVKKRAEASCDIHRIDSVTYGLCDHFQVLPWELKLIDGKELEEVETEYRNRFLFYYQSLVAFNKTSKIQKVIYAQGYVSGADACRQFSLRFGVPRLSIENVANKDRILWDDVSGIAVNKTLAKNYYFGYKDIVESEFAIKYVRGKIQKIRETKIAEHVSGSKRCDGDNFILFLGQVFTDTSILFSAEEGWGPIEVIRALKQESTRHSLDLQIKLHPKEYAGKSSLAGKMYDSLTYRKMKAVPGLLDSGIQVDCNNSLDTYDLIKKAALVVTMNSQAGLEAALFEKPVICCAQSNYSNLGFTLDCRDAKELGLAVSKALGLEPAERSRLYEHACKFDYIFNEIYCIPKTIRSFTGKACQ
jgi:hypothetical protein